MPVHEERLRELQSMQGVVIDLLPAQEVSPQARPAEVAPDVLSDVSLLFCTVPPTNFAAMEKVRWIQVSSAGYSQLFGLNLVERGIRASNARGCFDVPIAEWNVAMMVNIARDLRQMIRNQDAQVWDRDARFQSEIRGLTVGIWGYGGIGRETARCCEPWGCAFMFCRETEWARWRTCIASRHGRPRRRFSPPCFSEGSGAGIPLRSRLSDPRNAAHTGVEGIVGERELRALPSSAFVLNPSRGPLIQEAALLQALRKDGLPARRSTHTTNIHCRRSILCGAFRM